MSNFKEKKQTSLYLPPEILREIKLFLLENPQRYRTLNDFYIEAILEKLKKERGYLSNGK